MRTVPAASSRRPGPSRSAACLLGVLGIFVPVLLAQKTLFAPEIGNDTLAVAVDACLWTGAYLTTTSEDHDSSWLIGPHGMRRDSAWTVVGSENAFERSRAFAGLTLRLGRHAYARGMLDLAEINGAPAHDLAAGLQDRNLDFRVGQFNLPMGYEITVEPHQVDFIDYTHCAQNRTPTGDPRDIGAMLSNGSAFLQYQVALINGAGRNVPQDVDLGKNLAFRLLGMPAGDSSMMFGFSGYLGADTLILGLPRFRFTRLGVEAGWNRPEYFLRGECISGWDSTAGGIGPAHTISGAYVAMGFRVGAVQPVVRYEEFTRDSAVTGTFCLGLNVFLFHDMVKPMLDVSTTEDRITRTSTSKLALQIQTAFW